MIFKKKVVKISYSKFQNQKKIEFESKIKIFKKNKKYLLKKSQISYFFAIFSQLFGQ
jgi:hypothetical protein